MKEMGRQGREAFRAIYLASPLKFCTTLHAFARVTPQYHISAWEKDPWAWQRHKYHRSRSRVRGRFCYIGGPMGGVKSAGWPEPSLLGTRGLVEAASRAQAERLEDYEFWQQVAERAIKLRDVMDVGSLAVILDALLTANHRHTHLMKTLSRELVDDVDKLSLVEAAVVLNAYAHFSCVSAPLLTSLSQHVARLLTSQPYTTVDREHKYGVGVADPQTLAVLCKAFASLKHKDSAMLQAINGALVERIEDASFASTSDVLTAFADLGEPFEAPSSFWASLAAKVPGSQMRYLCPALRSFSKLDVSNADLYQAVGTEILSGLQMAPAGPEQIAPAQEAQLLGRRGRFPAFAPALPLPSAMLAVPGPGPSPAESSAAAPERLGEDVIEDFGQALSSFPSGSTALDLAQEAGDDGSTQDETNYGRRRRRWYNAVSRRVDSLADSDWPKVPYYAPFSAEEHYARNLRGARVAQALEGFASLEQQVPATSSTSPSASSSSSAGGAGGKAPATTSQAVESVNSSPSLEQELLRSAGPVLSDAVQGLSTSQLALCAELFAPRAAAGGEATATVQVIMRESVRRLSNFSVSDLRRLHAAARTSGIPLDLYLERARLRRFPKALRKELRDESPATQS